MNDRQPTSASKADEAPGAQLADPNHVYRRALDWAARHHVDASGGVQPENGHGLLSTCLAIFLRVHFQSLREVSAQERLSWVRYLRAYQKSDTGFFVDPALGIPEAFAKVGSADVDNPVTRLVTCFVLQALKVLDTPATSELRFMDALGDRRAVEAWLETADWSNAALQSERMMCVLLFLIHRAEHEQRPYALALYHRILDWCEALQDSKTGLIGVATDNFPFHSIVATDRLVPFFTYVHRPIQRVAPLVDTILSLQETGDALSRSRGSAREALAAINLLGLLGRQSTYHSADVKDALVRSYRAIVAMQREDGSFPDTRSPVPESHLFDSPKVLAGSSVSGNLSSLWIRILTLTIIEHRYPDTFPAARPCRFQPWPGLGYHSSSKTLTDHERHVLPLWIRPTACPAEPHATAVTPTPVVSVVIPCYNLGRYLHEAVESVLAQGFDNFEIIVVDDGSTDEYTHRLLEHFDRPKTMIIRQSNQGVSTARNNGIRAGTGRYICCLDPDDRLGPGFFAKAVAVLDSHDDVGLVSGSIAEFDEREHIVRRGTCLLRDLLTQNPIVEPAMFRRQAWDEAGGYPSGFSSGGEDWDLFLGILEAGYRAEVLPDVVWEYRIHADQMSTGMNRPGTWGQVLRQLVTRHSASYHEHLPDVVAALAVQFAESRAWAAECRAAALWWERQSSIWQRQAEALEHLAASDDQKVQSQQARIAELERRLLTIEPKRLTRRVSLWLAKLGRSQHDRPE
jgi:GT2 family glycosyltransferase